MRSFLSPLLTAALSLTSKKPTTNMAPPSIKLTYFDLEGRGEPIRLALVLSGTPFEDERIKREQWMELKPKTPFGQLPVMTIDDGPMRAQSDALLRWVGSNCSTTLYPRETMLDIDEAIGVLKDMMESFMPAFRMGFGGADRFGYPEGFAKTEEGQELVKKLREAWVKDELPKYLGYLTTLIEKNGGGFLASKDSPTIADCLAIPSLRGLTRGFMDYVPTNCLDSHPEVVKYIQRFCALQPIKGRYTDGIH